MASIVDNNKPDDEIQFERSLVKLDHVKLDDITAIRPFLTEFEDIYNDIQDANGTLTRSQLITKILAALPRPYNSFIQHWRLTHFGKKVSADDFKEFRSLLLNYADDNGARWQANKDNKSKDHPKDHPKDTASKDKTKTGRSGKAGKQDSPHVNCNHCGHSGHTIDTCRYVGKPDTPKCTFCEKLGHTEDKCNAKERAAKVKAEPTAALALRASADPGSDRDYIIAAVTDFDADFNSAMDLNCTYPRPAHLALADAVQKRESICSEAWGALLSGPYEDGSDSIHSPNISSVALATAHSTPTTHHWICDSGASRHITNDRSLFTELTPCTETIGACKQGAQLDITGTGTIEMTVTNSRGKVVTLQLHNVRHAPQARCNLLSISSLADSGPGFVMITTKDHMKVYRKDTKAEVAYAPRNFHINVYVLPVERLPPQPVVTAAVDFNDPVWAEHRRLGHLGLESMRRLTRMSTGMTVTDAQIKAKLKDNCPICHTTRALYKIPRDPANRHYQQFGELVTVDTWGPYPVPGLNGEKYALFLIDDATRFTWAELFSSKDTISAKLISLLTRLVTEHGKPIRRLRCDNEFVTNVIKAHCADHGITMEPSVPYAHHMVGAVERSHRVVRERAAAMIQDFAPTSVMTTAIVNRTEEMLRNATLPEGLWTYALLEAVHKKNNSPSKALKYVKTPYEALYQRQPNLSKASAWGARVYVTISPELRDAVASRKLHTPRAYIAHFLCTLSDDICYVWDSDARQVKRISIARIDNTTGMTDPQPHGQHINQRLPQDPVPTPTVADDSDSDSDHDDLYAPIALTAMEDALDWDDTPLPVLTMQKVPPDQACGPCVRRQRPCYKHPEDSNLPCSYCTTRMKVNCYAQTQADRDVVLTAQDNKARRKQAFESQPTTSPYFARLSPEAPPDVSTDGVGAPEDVLVARTPSPHEHTMRHDSDCDTIVPDSQPDSENDEGYSHYHSTTRNAGAHPCASCVQYRKKCKFTLSSTTSKCDYCVKRPATCVPATSQQITQASNCCAPCREKKHCTRGAPGPVCDPCIATNNYLNCKPVQVQVRATLPSHQRCYTCQN